MFWLEVPVLITSNMTGELPNFRQRHPVLLLICFHGSSIYVFIYLFLVVFFVFCFLFFLISHCSECNSSEQALFFQTGC